MIDARDEAKRAQTVRGAFGDYSIPNMEALCHELGTDGRLAQISLSDGLARWRGGDGVFWIDVDGSDEASLEALLDQVGVNEFLKDRCLHAGNTTVVVATPQGTFSDVMVFADRACTRRTRVSVLSLHKLLITMSPEPVEGVGAIREAIESLEIGEISTSRVLCTVLLEHAAFTGQHVHALRERLLAIGDRMDHDMESVSPEEVEEVVHSVLLAFAVANEQAEAFALLPNAASEGFATEELASPLGLLITTSASTERLARRLDDRAENLLRRRRDYKNELLNRRLALLTIISAIFMPLTLFAGIWGMNFEHMPELSRPYAYPAALSFMAAMGLGGVWIFYKRGWFD